MHKFLPILQWFPDYKAADIPRDIVAGLTVGVILIPQAIAYAMIAGLPPQYGLYGALVPLVVYVFLGTSRFLALGPVAIDSLLVSIGLGAAAISDSDYIGMAIFLALLVGTIQFLLGLLRMGFLVHFLSKPVISAFISAAALIILIGQLKTLLGLKIANSGNVFEVLGQIVENIDQTNFYDLAIGILGAVFIIVMKKWKRNFPVALAVVVLGILAVYFFDLESKGVEIVGIVPSGLPSFGVPEINAEAFSNLWPIALTLALLGYLETISIAKGMEEKSGDDRLDPNQELVALGLSNLVGSFFKAYPISSSFSRSAISGEAGSRSNFSGLFAALLVLLTLLFLTSLFYYLPNAVLASIIIVAVSNLIDWSYAKRLWNVRKDEFVVWIISFFAVLLIGIIQGVLLGVLLSLLLMVYRTSNPHVAILGRIGGSEYYKNIERFRDDVEVRDELLIVRFDAQLYFGNADYFKKRMYKYVQAKGEGLKAVILNAESMNYIDSTGVQMLKKVISKIKSDNVEFYIVGAIGPTRDILFNSGVVEIIGKEYLFVRIHEAVKHFDSADTASTLTERIARQRNIKKK